jgi:hypothetical protein
MLQIGVQHYCLPASHFQLLSLTTESEEEERMHNPTGLSTILIKKERIHSVQIIANYIFCK